MDMQCNSSPIMKGTPNIDSRQEPQGGQTYALILMSTITFVAVLCEMLPAGILVQLRGALGVNAAEAGQLIGVYALASAICAIPLVTATMRFNRKRLLLWLLMGFAVSNFGVGLANSYTMALLMRVVAGVASGILWSMITAYGMRLVPPRHHGRAIAIIMAGTTFGVSLGMPFMTWIGNTWGWRIEFFALGGLVVLIALLCYAQLPSVEGEKVTRANNPFALLRNRRILIVLLLTLLGVMAHYASYAYITDLVQQIELPGGIEIALLLFGVGPFISMFLAMRFADTALRTFTTLAFLSGAVALIIVYMQPQPAWAYYVAFALWGLSFGPLGAMLQAAVARHSETAKAIATSVQSSMFNFSIMFATAAGGSLIAGSNGDVMHVITMSILLLAAAALLAGCAKNTLGQR